MPIPTAPLFFPQALQATGDLTELGKPYGLTREDFEWLKHLKLSSHALRNQQTPPMHAENILIGTGDLSVALAGSFMLSATPQDHGAILYMPYAGIRKFASRAALSEHLKGQLEQADENDESLAFLSLSARKTLAAASDISVAFETIEGDVFQEQRVAVTVNQRINDQAMVDELRKLPALDTLLDTVLAELLKTAFPSLDQRRTLVAVAGVASIDATDPSPANVSSTLSLSEALLLYYRHQGWPTGQRALFSHPQRTAQPTDQKAWETAIKSAADSLASRLAGHLQHFWSEASVDGATRRVFFIRALREKVRAELLLKRESQRITPQQSQALQALIASPHTASTLTLETVRLWEQPSNYVELAGSLMISPDSASAFLYTPARGLLAVKDYQELIATLRKNSTLADHDDELYALMSLEERDLFIGFEQPYVSGAALTGGVFETLFEAIIGKQQQNLEYTLQVFRFSDRELNVRAFFDKALDVRSLISESLLTVEVQGRWSTRPALSGYHPSMVLADTAAGYVKTFSAVETPMHSEFAAQPVATLAGQREYLASMKAHVAHAFSVGLRGEAALRELSGSLRNADWAVVNTVFNPDRPERKTRAAVRGFYPDAYSLALQCSGEVFPLPNCVVLTERGGVDTQHSGRAILWTPGAGLEVFNNVNEAREQLNLRLLDPDQRLVLLENLTPVQRKYHRRYSLYGLQLIAGNVLEHLAQAVIEQFLARCEHVRSLKLGPAQSNKALEALKQTAVDPNLRRASWIAQAISHQPSLPAWLGMAPIDEQQLHIELLEQYRNTVTDDKDYLHGLQTLEEYVRDTLKRLLSTRIPGATLDPDLIEIIPNLALAGPAQSLTRFALNHVSVAQGTGFKVASGSTGMLPASLNEAAVRQLLQSLNIQQVFGKKVTDALTGADAAVRKTRFVQQLPWQLLHHAHALKLQRHLSQGAFDLVTQVVDLPDAIARAAVQGAHALVKPVELITTTGATALEVLGLYLISPGVGKQGSHVLYAPYHSGPVFSEFANEASLVAAINTPGALQDLVVSRLPSPHQSTLSNLLKSTVGQISEITLGTTLIDGHFLLRLFADNTRLIARMLGSQALLARQFDWEKVKSLFSVGIKQTPGLLPGKLAYLLFLWQSYKDFKDSAENLQTHHWDRAMRSFIAGAAQMISLGKLSLEAAPVSASAASHEAPIAHRAVEPHWSAERTTAPKRTGLQLFETTSLELKDLTKEPADGTYYDPVGKKRYAPVAGKVYPVAKPGAVWQIHGDEHTGPTLQHTASRQLVLDPDVHTVHYGKALSTMRNNYINDSDARKALNIEARGMDQIRLRYPKKARQIVQAIDLARFYAFNSLHNLVQLRQLLPGTRLVPFLKGFFDVAEVDTALLDKIGRAIIPICNALVDPTDELLDSSRFIVGYSRHRKADVLAFVLDQDLRKHVYFTERYFDQELDTYAYCLTEPFDIDAHSQAAILIHEFAHSYVKAVDIASIEARRPFIDLVSPFNIFGADIRRTQLNFQRQALSLATPEENLFACWDDRQRMWVDLDAVPGMGHVGEAILKLTKSRTMAEARKAFLDPVDPTCRIDVILNNADSLAFLICAMGRQLDPVSAGIPFDN